MLMYYVIKFLKNIFLVFIEKKSKQSKYELSTRHFPPSLPSFLNSNFSNINNETTIQGNFIPLVPSVLFCLPQNPS